MKKYFISNGTEQQGPFDLYDLKRMNVQKETLIWYEGIDNWQAAKDIDEIKEIFVATPPPLPPTRTIKLKKKNNNAIYISIFIILGVLIAGGIIIIKNNPNIIPGVKVDVNIPKPVVVTSRADKGKSSIFNARVTVYASIYNQGGSGNVLITFHVIQGDKTYDKDMSIFLGSGQSQDVQITFEEVNYLDGQISYGVNCRAE